MFFPSTRDEMKARGWAVCDVVLVTGDAVIDHPLIGVSVIGQALEAAGFRVGIIGQPDIESDKDVGRLGEPLLFWGVTGGSIDSMVANYTASKKRRKGDDYTPGGVNDRRPDRAVIAYTNLIRRYFKNTKPIVLGGIEASLRRISHYDFWSDSIRRSILFDAKADYLLYGMAERSVVELAERLRDGQSVQDLPGLCHASSFVPEDAVVLPSHEEASKDPEAFIRLFKLFDANQDPITAKPLVQKQDTRYLVHNPPPAPVTQKELDAVYAWPYERDVHPFHQKAGKVKALDTIRFSITTHRGCPGECRFCSIASHECRALQWRSEASIVAEAEKLAKHSLFKGIIQDVGGATANLYASGCHRMNKLGVCPDRRCLTPEICPNFKFGHDRQLHLLKRLRQISGVRKVFVSSGIRHDVVLADEKDGERYLDAIIRNHVSGQMKIAPEHTEPGVLKLMGKPGPDKTLAFRKLFNRMTKSARKDQYLTYYLIAAHPGCTDRDMRSLARFATSELKIHPEQVQLFIPLPSTWSAVMYHTGIDPFTNRPIFVEKNPVRRERQKAVVVEKKS